MTALDVPPAAEDAGTAPGRAVRALARSEARRLLRHPLFVVPLLGWVAFLLQPGEPEEAYPVLQHVDRETQLGGLLMGLAVLLAANSAVLRARRHGVEPHFGTLVMPLWRRTVAHALSVLPAVLVVAAVVGAEFARAAVREGAVGRGSVAELLTGPLVVLCLGALGVLLGRVSASAFAAPAAALAVIALVFVVPVTSDRWGWLAPIGPEGSYVPLPSDLMDRPAGWHAVYLLGLAVLAAAVAVLAAGGRTRLVRAVAAGALAVTVTGAVLQGAGVSESLTAARREAAVDPAPVQDCVRHGATTYCAFPEFTPWTARWREVAEEVRALAGEPAAGRDLTVRQRVPQEDDPGGMGSMPPSPSGEVSVGTSWGGGSELETATSIAHGLVVDDEAGRKPYCDARGVLVVWLAVSALPEGEETFAAYREERWGGGVSITTPARPVTIRDRELAVVQALLDEPRADVAERVRESWTELVRSGTTTDRAAGLLGVDAPRETADDREWACA